MKISADGGRQRIAPAQLALVKIMVDGQPLVARRGECVLTALRTAMMHLRNSEFSGERRAGFCMMGACQDCWLWRSDGGRLRGCTSRVEEGMQLVTVAPEFTP